MKYIFVLTGILIFLIISAVYAVMNPVFSFFLSKSKEMVDVDKKRLYEDVKFLNDLDPSRSIYHPESLDKAAGYIFSEFEKAGLSPSYQRFKAFDNNIYKNVIGILGDTTKPRIVVGAHYDVCGDQPGADDNASGIAGILELARVLKGKVSEKYCIEFVAYANEEPPFFATSSMGSAFHAKSLSDGKIKVAGMICLEMIGYFSEEPKSQDYPIGLLHAFYPDKGNFIAVVGKIGQGGIVRSVKKNMKRGSEIAVVSINAPASLVGVDFSDHRNYWPYNYDAVMITNTSFYRNKNYHEQTDSIETLNFDKMAEVVRGVAYAIIHFH